MHSICSKNIKYQICVKSKIVYLLKVTLVTIIIQELSWKSFCVRGEKYIHKNTNLDGSLNNSNLVISNLLNIESSFEDSVKKEEYDQQNITLDTPYGKFHNNALKMGQLKADTAYGTIKTTFNATSVTDPVHVLFNSVQDANPLKVVTSILQNISQFELKSLNTSATAISHLKTSSLINATTEGEVAVNGADGNTGMFDRDEALARAEITTLAVIFALTLAGNSAVLLALYARRRFSGRRKLSRMYFFILHLSVADLVTAFFNVLPQLAWDVTYRFQGGAVLCKAVKFAQPVGPYLSSYVLTATAVDRHQAICHPLTYCAWTSRRSRAMVWIAWICALLFCIPQVIIFSYQEVSQSPSVYDCWGTFPEPWGARAYVTWYSISVFIVPLCVLVSTYTCICREIWHSAGRGRGPPLQAVISPPTSPPGTPCKSSNSTSMPSTSTRRRVQPLISRAKINTVKQTVAVIAMYVVCSSPFISAQLWATWYPHAAASSFSDGATFTILTLLSSLNSCVNPWIYLCFNRDLLKLLFQLIRGGPHKNYTAGATNSASNSSQGIETTSLRVPSRISFTSSVRNGCSSSNGSGKAMTLVQRGGDASSLPPSRRQCAQYKSPRHWLVVTPT